MLWKDRYKIGVESIDRQHMELFRMTEMLLAAIARGATAAEYEEVLSFFDQYVVEHFRDEEAYQESIGYCGLALHREEHRQFTQLIQDYVKRWQESGHDLSVMKNLSGMAMAWLIYHVISSDRKIISDEISTTEYSHHDRCVELFAESALDVLEMMAGLDRSQVQLHNATPYLPRGDVYITIELVGDRHGTVVFAFSKELACSLVCAMTMMEIQEMDEIVQSALCEITNISCGNGATALAARGVSCDIRPPVVSTDFHCDHSGVGLHLNTQMGWMEIAVLMEDPSQQILPQ